MDGTATAPLPVVEMSERIARLLDLSDGEVRIEIMLRDGVFRHLYLHRDRVEAGQLRRYGEDQQGQGLQG